MESGTGGGVGVGAGVGAGVGEGDPASDAADWTPRLPASSRASARCCWVVGTCEAAAVATTCAAAAGDAVPGGATAAATGSCDCAGAGIGVTAARGGRPTEPRKTGAPSKGTADTTSAV